MPVVGSTAYATAGAVMDLVRSLLNDVDFPFSTNIITPTGAVRASNVVTITTSAAHGLVVGQRVTVASVTDSTFNGTFVIASVPTATTFTYAQALGNASSGNGTVEVINPGDVFTDTILLPFVNKAYRKVQYRMLKKGSKSLTSEVTLTLTAGSTSFTDTGSPPLPTDFLAPRELQEKPSGNQRFMSMSPIDVLPDQPQAAALQVWSWREEGLWFIGSTLDVDVLIRYFRSLPDAVSRDSQLLIRGCLDPVADVTAKLAAGAKDANLGSIAYLDGLFEQDMHEMLNVQSLSGQYSPARRIPYGGRRRRFR